MALKLFENLFKKDQAKKNEEENLKSEIEDIQLDSEQNDGSFEDETDLNTSMEKTIFEEIKNADEVIDCEDTSEVKEEIEVQEIKETEEISEVKDTEVIEKKGIFARLKEGLKKTSDSFTEKFDNLFKGSLKIDDDLYEELEEILITSDIIFYTTLKIV